ncbi:MAG: pyridoxamine 5'-phosphate oxidase [Bacteroidota bacterium]|nr:pyridoxamine 5'-phosphate oxidase [Bacteroidota bacterium]
MPASGNIITHLRKEYARASLDESTVNSNPIDQFILWFEEALNANVLEPNALSLATATTDGKPSSRIVLLKGVSESGFTFYTNYQSRKGQQISQNPYGAMTFLWLELERQVRIEGHIEKTTGDESDAYFAVRPRGSQVGAWISPQSQNISRNELEQVTGEMEERFRDQEIPRPPHWGGYRLMPTRIEFWQGRPNRLHDRILYTSDRDKWEISRLAP